MRILTGIQSSGEQHLGNVLGAIKPAIELSKTTTDQSLFFIANLHTLTSKKSATDEINNTWFASATWLACGLDIEKDILYRQSDIPQVCELSWYLSTFTPMPMLNNSPTYKDKSENLSDVNAGLFTYPILMSADILLYDADIVPVGKDQKSHLEMCRDIAKAVNYKLGDVFKIPEAKIKSDVATIPGTDGRKMSKSYNNYINIFDDEKKLRKSINNIKNEPATLEEPKDPDTCNIVNIFKLVANEEQVLDICNKYRNGNYGHSHAKNYLYEVILENFKNERERFNTYKKEPQIIYNILEKGKKIATEIANENLSKIRNRLGF